MIITCESCTTQFQLDSSRIPAQGIRVRCTICKHAFFVENHEAETGDPIDRAVGRALIEDEEGLPGVAHDLASSTQGGDFAESFAAARSAVDDLLGFGAPSPAAEPAAAAAAEPAPATQPWEGGAQAEDEIVFDVDEALANEQVPGPPPEPDPFGAASEPAATAPEPWSAPALADAAPALGDASDADLGLDPELGDAGLGLDPELDPWDTSPPGDGPALSEQDEQEPAGGLSTPDADPWDTPLPFEVAPAEPTPAAPATDADAPVRLGSRWEDGKPAEDEADALEAEEEDLADALAAEAPSDASLELETDAPGEAPADELEEALKLGWGGDTDTAGLEIAAAGAAASRAALDAQPGAASERWEDLDLGAGPAAARDARQPGSAAEARLPGIGVGTRLGAPRRRRVVAWLATLGDGTGWTIVAGLAAVLLWASLAPPVARERSEPAIALAGLEASGIAGRWIDNALVGPVLVVSGELRNAGPAARIADSRLVVRLLDAAGAPLDGKATSAGVPLDRERLREASAAELRAARDASAAALARVRLAPGESTRFEAVLLSVPEAAGRFEVAAEGAGGGSS